MNQRRPRSWDPGHDERVEPHKGLTPHMPDPDWGSILIQPELKKAPVGDPTLWGNTVNTLIDSAPQGNQSRVIQGDQIVLAQAQDHYSRSWSLTGTLTLPIDAWNGPVGGSINPTSPYDVGAQAQNLLSVWLSLSQGIEKVTVEQQILLMAGSASDNFGLCNNQYVGNGGPFANTFPTLPTVDAAYETRAFAGVTLIGNTINIRAIYVRGGVVGSKGQIPDATISLIITPFAPGQGL